MPFTRTFAHRDWADGEDLVQAGSTPHDDGFNARFHQIEDDLDALGEFVNETLLGERAVSFVPDFSLTDHFNEPQGWVMGSRGAAAMRSSQTSAVGKLPLSLPHGASLIELHVCGNLARTYILFKLIRKAHQCGSSGEHLIPLEHLYGETEFDEHMPILTGDDSNIVDNRTFQYYLEAEGQRAETRLRNEIQSVAITYTFDP